jgi:dihydroxy-acid dehydratase
MGDSRKNNGTSMKHRSREVFEDHGLFVGIARRSILQGLGIEQQEMREKPVIAIANSYAEFNPGHTHLRAVADRVKEGIWAAGGIPFEFGVPAPCDGPANGNEGMRFILAQREIIADAVETYVRSQLFDGLVTLSSCDKINPAMLMAAARLDLPTICIPGGACAWNIRFCPGGQDSINTKDYESLELKIQTATPATCGACEIMGTANTGQILMEALGMALPRTSAIPAFHEEVLRKAREAGKRIVGMISEGLTARRILTKQAVENAVMVDVAVGGSTNATLHLPALAHEIGVELSLKTFNEMNRKIPTLLGIAPNGPHGIVDLYRAGGVPAVMSRIRDRLNLDCMNVSGRKLGEIVSEARVLDESVIPPLDRPRLPEGATVILYGNLAPEGAVVKQSAVDPSMRTFTGRALVLNGEQEALDALKGGKIEEGTVIVIRYEGPKGGPGMPEILAVTLELVMSGLSRVALITDGRFSGATSGPCVGHVSPEAYVGGPIGLLEDGDRITIDIPKRSISVDLSDDALEKRRRLWQPVQKPVPPGYMNRYRRLVGSAAKGAVLG